MPFESPDVALKSLLESAETGKIQLPTSNENGNGMTTEFAHC